MATENTEKTTGEHLNDDNKCSENIEDECTCNKTSSEEESKSKRKPWQPPGPQGLYDPSYEHASCGVGFIVSLDNTRSHKILCDARTMSVRMEHREFVGDSTDHGDGAGVLCSIPHELYDKYMAARDITLPPNGDYATGIIFTERSTHKQCERLFEKLAKSLDVQIIAWRTVPTNPAALNEPARVSEPLCRQVFLFCKGYDVEMFERQIYIIRKRASHEVASDENRFYICSLSNKIIVYKGMLTTDQLWTYYTDLTNPDFMVYLAMAHTRFSTNTFPSWERAHPMRMIAHNGEINTLKGNVTFMKAREGIMQSDLFGNELKNLFPVVEPGFSDSGSFDCVLEFLTIVGQRSLPEAIMTMIPEPWENDTNMPQARRDFYQWATCVMEPWDGPALMAFTDGRFIGAVLDRNGLRPARYIITTDNILVMASEVGAYPVDPSKIVIKHRLRPCKMLLVDTLKNTIIHDSEVKSSIVRSRPHSQWVKQHMSLEEIVEVDKATQEALPHSGVIPDPLELRRVLHKRLALFGCAPEAIKLLLIPMIKTSSESLGSMGNDVALPCLSEFQPLPYEYFKQLFAQVTNPPIDPLHSEVNMSLETPIGPESNLLKPSADQVQRLWLKHPILSITQIEALKRLNYRGWRSKILDMTYPFADGIEGYRNCLRRVYIQGEQAAESGYQLLILSDRNIGDSRVALSALLALGGLHSHLVEKRLRKKVALIVETAEARQVHHHCLLIGFGAGAICPYLILELAQALRDDGVVDPTLSNDEIYKAYAKATESGIRKIMAKMGISCMQSYKGAQLFEAIGLGRDVIGSCFTGCPSRLGGISFEMLAKDVLERFHRTYGKTCPEKKILLNVGHYIWRNGGETHLNDPITVAALQHATKNYNLKSYKEFCDAHMERLKKCSLRGQLDFASKLEKIDISQVESASDIIKRFSTGAMSFGSVSAETHSTLAIAMNSIGGKSNSGEGGEETERYKDESQVNNRRSAIKQIASGRFGVTASFLAHADVLQIKISQPGKAGEGGELPGHKSTNEIAKVRRALPGLRLISPPPHHDVSSIEDLSQLVYDLKCINPNAEVSVKLVSEIGIGIIASGVAKSKADHIEISGFDGASGASTWTGIMSGGLPWELGVAEAHQVLVLNDLRSKVKLQVNGGLRTGFDVVVAAILGADEYSFGTAPLIALGCTLMRKCHLNTCPVGIATQDPALRKKFIGKPEHLKNYFIMLAEETRQIMANLGIRKIQDLIGRTELLQLRKNLSERASYLDLSLLLKNALDLRPGTNIIAGSVPQVFDLTARRDYRLLEKVRGVIKGTEDAISVFTPITVEDRTFGTSISSEIAKKYSEDGLPDGRTITIHLEGSAGPSFAAFLVTGVTVILKGDANEFVGKGLSGGTIVILPTDVLKPESHLHVIAGNICLYGANYGKAFFRGIVAERFCVRNSGAIAVAEGCGTHGCEYMTGGTVIVLGTTGSNFASGMTGGIAYVYDADGTLPTRINKECVELLPLEIEEDIKIVTELIGEFIERTGSLVAKAIIANWEESRLRFWKIFPYALQLALKEARGEHTKTEFDRYKDGTGDYAILTPCSSTEQSVVDIEDYPDGIHYVVQKSEKPGNIMIDKRRGFIKYKREKRSYRNPIDRIQDWGEIYNLEHVKNHIRVQAARCMDCGVAFCHSSTYGCPLGNVIPNWNEYVFHGVWKKAAHHLLQTNNFPEFTGRVCPAPCEDACVVGISDEPVTIRNIECTIIEHAFENGWIEPEIPEERTGKNVAIIGSGPAGLAAASQLNKAGHFVTVYERNDRLGGLLQYGISSMKLSKDIIARRINLLKAEGITFKTNWKIGRNIEAACLVNEYDAILLAIGASRPRNLIIPNRDLKGIYFAMTFLESQQRMHMGGNPNIITAYEKDVIIIGTAIGYTDCIATALRQGAKSITTFELLPKPPEKRAQDNPWPQSPNVFRVDFATEEVKIHFGKDPRQYSTQAESFIGEHGHVTGINTIQVKWVLDADKEWYMEEIASSDSFYPADLVLIALGYLGPERVIAVELGLELDSKRNIRTANGLYTTTYNPKIFAAGDCRRGSSSVAWAIAEGREAARHMDTYLRGKISGLPGPGGIPVLSKGK